MTPKPPPPAKKKTPDERIAEILGPPADLSSWKDAGPPPWLVEGLLQRGCVSLFSARGGVGKSLLTLDLILAITSGRARWLDFPIVPDGGYSAVLIEAECGGPRLARRIRELVLGGSLLPEDVKKALQNLRVHAADGILERFEAIGALERLLKRKSRDLVVLDPLRSFLPLEVEDENDNVAVGRVLDHLVGLAHRFHAAILVVDHDSKTGITGRGASAKQDSAGFVLHLARSKKKAAHELELALEKARDPAGADSIGIRVVRGKRTAEGLYPVRFEHEAASSVRSKIADEEILDAVAGLASEKGSVGPSALAQAFDVHKSTVSRWLKPLVAAGKLRRAPKQGHVCLPAADTEDHDDA